MSCWLAPCDLGDPGWGIPGFRMVRSLLRSPSGLTEFGFHLDGYCFFRPTPDSSPGRLSSRKDNFFTLMVRSTVMVDIVFARLTYCTVYWR